MDPMWRLDLHGIWMLGNDFFSYRSGVPTDIMLFGLSTFTKEL